MLLDRGRVCIEKYERISFQDSFHSGAEQFTSMAFGRRQQQLLATATNLGNVCFWRQQQPVPIHSFIQETAALFIYLFILVAIIMVYVIGVLLLLFFYRLNRWAIGRNRIRLRPARPTTSGSSSA